MGVWQQAQKAAASAGLFPKKLCKTGKIFAKNRPKAMAFRFTTFY
jgi:hypothetical protein